MTHTSLYIIQMLWRIWSSHLHSNISTYLWYISLDHISMGVWALLFFCSHVWCCLVAWGYLNLAPTLASCAEVEYIITILVILSLKYGSKLTITYQVVGLSKKVKSLWVHLISHECMNKLAKTLFHIFLSLYYWLTNSILFHLWCFYKLSY